jgi:ferritin-like protein
MAGFLLVGAVMAPNLQSTGGDLSRDLRHFHEIGQEWMKLPELPTAVPADVYAVAIRLAQATTWMNEQGM